MILLKTTPSRKPSPALCVLVMLVFLGRSGATAQSDSNSVALLQAASTINFAAHRIKALLAAGADVNARNGIGETALILVSRNGDAASVAALLAAGADVNAKSHLGETALIEASRGGHLNVVSKLLTAGADVNATSIDGKGALDTATDGKHGGVARLLKKAGAVSHQENGLGHDDRVRLRQLIIDLSDSVPETRGTAAYQLGERRDPRAVEALIAALNDPYMKDSEYGPAAVAAAALGKIGDRRAVGPLIAALQGTAGGLRKSASRALAGLKDPRAVDPLIAALRDSSVDVRASAAAALGELQDLRAVEPLIAALKDSSANVVEFAAGALGKLHDTRAVEPLIESLKNPSSRYYAISALGEIPDPRSILPLFVMLNDNEPGAHKALENINDPRAVEPLIVALEDKSSHNRDFAAELLGKFRDPRVVNPLIAALGDLSDGPFRDDSPSARAVVALEQIGPIAVEPLIAAMADPDPAVRMNSLEALKQIDDPRAHAAAQKAKEKLSQVAASYAPLIEKGVPGSEDLLIDALNQFGDKGMAESYLNCGNPKLEKAGSAWADRSGFQVREQYGGNTVRWGDAR